MFCSYFFDGNLDDLDEGLPNHDGFLMLSQGGFLRCVEKSAPIKATVIAHLEGGIIHGNRHPGVHYFLTSCILEAGQESALALQKKLAIDLKLGCSTYNSLLTAQSVINSHFEEAIATLIDSVTDDNHLFNASIFERISDNYAVLAKFNPQKYMQTSADWRRKQASYRRAFCKQPQSVSVTLR